MKIRRSQAFKNLANQINFDYYKDDKPGNLAYLKEFKLFKIGGRKSIYNVLNKSSEDYAVNIFDYKYVISTGKSTRIHKQSVFFINSKKLGLPFFYLQPENIFHKLGQWLKITEDIDFNEFPEFSKQYYLKGPHQSFVRYTFDDDILEFFTDEKEWSAEGMNYYFIFYKKNKLIRTNQLQAFILKGLKLYEFLKREEEEEE